MRRIFLDYIFDESSIVFIICFVLIIIIRLFYVIISKKTSTGLRELMILIFWGSLLFVFVKTVLPTFTFYQINGENQLTVYRGTIKVNIIPFKTIAYFIAEEYQGDFWGGVINLLGNILLFVPIGFSSMYLLKYNLKKTIIYGCIISMTIEILQTIPGRSTDIDDVILNTLGVFIGCCVISGIKYLKPKNCCRSEIK